MDDAAHLLHHLGRPGEILLGTARTGTPARRLVTTVPPLDALLAGGIPAGGITEIAGPPSTGRTSLACAVAAAATRAGAAVAWIDPYDAFDPETAAAAGVALPHVLWVRPRDPAGAFRAADLLLAAGGFALVVLDPPPPEAAGRRGGPWPRLARAAERSGTALLVLSRTRGAGGHAALGLEATARRTVWSRGAGLVPTFDGIATRWTVARIRAGHTGDALEVRHACG